MSSNQGTMPGTILVGLLLSLPLLVVLPWYLVRRYKRSLDRWMRTTSDAGIVEPEDRSPAPSSPHLPPYTQPPAPSSPWHRVAQQRQQQCALVYAIGGSCSAASLTMALLGDSGVRSPLAFLTIFAANLWPVFLSLGIVLRWRRQAWLRYGLVYLCCLTACAVLQRISGGKATTGSLFLLLVLLNAPTTLFFRAISLRSIRRVGPALLPFCVAVVIGPQVLLHLGATHFSLALQIARVAGIIRFTPLGGIVLAALLTLPVMALLGRFLAWLLAVLYRARQISDQTLLLDVLWLLFVGAQALVLLTTTGQETGSGSLWVLVAYPLYLLVVRLGHLALSRRRSQAPAPALLVLRAFALQQKAEAVFQPVTHHWRYIGPVRLIGGPDLATSTVEPSTFLEFISGRLGTLFIRSPNGFQNRISQHASTPDHDGRFRTDEFFCFRDTWRFAVTSLIRRSDVILADFRGLGDGRRGGCDWEVQEIVRCFSLSRCVFLLEPADDQYLHAILASATFPQIAAAAPRVLHLAQSTDRSLDELLSTLFSGLSQGGVSSANSNSEAA